MTKKIFRSMLLVAAAALLASLVVVVACMYRFSADAQVRQLKDGLDLAAAAVGQSGEEYLKDVADNRCRLTWVAADGSVLYDTKTDASTLPNHADREEIQDALQNGTGESVRYSNTLLEKTMYCARCLPDGTVLRISVSRATVGVLVVGMLQPIVLLLLLVLGLSAILARRLSHHIVEPLNELDLEHPLDNECYEELAPLLSRINRQRGQIDRQLCELQRKTDEFSQITGSMLEGLVLLDDRWTVLSINPAAQRIFGADSGCVGRDFLTVERSHEMSAAIEAAIQTGHSEFRLHKNGRIYQLDLSRIDSATERAGAVLLAFDITEQEEAEQNRREFTANVSHELKTPLQGIIGSAELLENGMVKPEDTPRFVGHIRAEAQRLVTLIGDIIRLSQLDEGDEMPTEPVDLADLAEEAAHDLQAEADKKHVTLHCDTQSACMTGVRRLLYEIIYNLIDNAVKYNVDGGRVDIQVAGEPHNVRVTVKDTGIGIAPEHQGRIFERFYRADKSHSKASGGTGLGLSIVKHSVQYHHGSIDLQSQPGKGTQISVTFPKTTETQ